MKPFVTMSFLLAVLLPAGCGTRGSSPEQGKQSAAGSTAVAAAMRALELDRSRTRPLGRGARFRPEAVSALVRAHAPLGWLRCGHASARPYGAHLELFAEGHEVAVPAGIGIAPPQRHQGASVERGACAYPIRTIDPTGVILVSAPAAGQAKATVGDLFKLWGQPLDLHHLAGFTAAGKDSTAAFLDGRRVRGNPDAIPLLRHAQIVLELGPWVQPHPSYRFASGL